MMRVSELTGAQLDYWVARAEGIPAEQLTIRRVQRSTDCHVVHQAPRIKDWRANPTRVLSYSADWAQGGPLIKKHSLVLDRLNIGAWISAPYSTMPWMPGTTPLQAICRAVVRAAFGDEVEEVAVHA